jgi:hypothetical protein
MKALPLFFLLAACTSTDNLEDSASPCVDVLNELPACPEECPEDYNATCGEACDAETPDCGNSIGDGRTCVDGVFSCAVHAPLGGPGECNWVCEPRA